jgi:NSS family neurotransmitter:Na+ symporter
VATTPGPSDRGQWSGKLAFILAAAGSAIGLGNVWRFPTSAAQSGGGLFVLIYLFFVFAIGVPVILAELSLGRATKRNPVGAFAKLAPSSWWPALGGLGVLTGFGILAFYAVIAGWTIGYLFQALTGAYGDPMSAEQSGQIFADLISSPGRATLLTGVFMLLTIWVVQGGVSKGIERTTKILMPVLFGLLILLALRAMTLPGGMAGVAFMFQPDFGELNAGVVLGALGQAFFSLSLGMGAMITYGSYFPDNEDLPVSGVSVAVFDTLIAILAGLIIFPALFAAGGDIESTGPGLVFVVLPTVFGTLPAGGVLAIAFYALLAIAALTSTISLLEVVVAYFVDERSWARKKAAWVVGVACFLVAIPSALANGAVPALANIFGTDWLTLNSIVWGNYSLSIGAFLTCVFVGWKWGMPAAFEVLEQGARGLPGKGALSLLIRVICPLAIAVTLGFIVITGNYL